VASTAQAVDKAKAQDAVVRALGRASAAENAPDVQKRFALLGVIAGAAGQGSALLMVDGQPARAFVRGQEVVDGWRLAAVDSTGVRLEPLQAGAALALPLPQRP
jgi:general secretion pathway protein C